MLNGRFSVNVLHVMKFCFVPKLNLWLDIPFDSRRIIRTTKVIGVFGNFDSPIIQILKKSRGLYPLVTIINLAAPRDTTVCVGTIHPPFDTVGIADASALSPRIEQHDDDRTQIDRCLHHQTTPGFIDKSGLAQADIPRGIPDQGIGVSESHGAAL